MLLSSTNAVGRVLVLSLISIEGSSLSTLHVDSVQKDGVVEEVGVQWSGTLPAEGRGEGDGGAQ